MTDSQSKAVQAFASCVLMLFLVDDTASEVAELVH